MNYFSSELERDRYEARIEAAQGLVNRLLSGEIPADMPWHDRVFQQEIVNAFGRMRGWQEDALKWAAAKELFGGSK